MTTEHSKDGMKQSYLSQYKTIKITPCFRELMADVALVITISHTAVLGVTECLLVTKGLIIK